MADNKAVNQTAAKPEEAKADKKAKANDGKKKVPFTAKVKNFLAVSLSISVIPKAS